MKKLSVTKIEKLLKNESLDPELKSDLEAKKKALSNNKIIRKNGSN